MDVKTKKFFYRALWVCTGLFLSTLAVALLEFYALRHNIETDGFALFLYLVIMLCGALIGLLAGRVFWKKIYEDGIRGTKYVVDGVVSSEPAKLVVKEGKKAEKAVKAVDIDTVMKWAITIFVVYLMVIISFMLAHRFVSLVEYKSAGKVYRMMQY